MCEVISQGVIKIRPLYKKNTAHPLGLFTFRLRDAAIGKAALNTDETYKLETQPANLQHFWEFFHGRWKSKDTIHLAGLLLFIFFKKEET